MLADRLVQIGQALAVLGGKRDRRSEAQTVGLAHAGEAGAALGLVGDQHHRHLLAAQPGGEVAIGGHDAVAGIDDEEHQIDLVQRLLGLEPHAPGQRLDRRLFQAGGVDDGEGEIGNAPRGFPDVAGGAGYLRHEGDMAADEAVEQRRLADVGAADDGYSWKLWRVGHGTMRYPVSFLVMAGLVPAIHVFLLLSKTKTRGCPAQGRA